MAKDYRVYVLNEAGHIVGAHEICCDTDDEATALAGEHGGEREWELWNRDRLVRINRLADKGAIA